jgi:hypothetical protein
MYILVLVPLTMYDLQAFFNIVLYTSRIVSFADVPLLSKFPSMDVMQIFRLLGSLTIAVGTNFWCLDCPGMITKGDPTLKTSPLRISTSFQTCLGPEMFKGVQSWWVAGTRSERRC